ncbi:MAG: Holliday junction resolvase RuvX [Paludibacteraceae bacterium]|nr:Holliday junction resolvase RuvX [Paludibacteraceae bacterium]
MGRVLAIDYGRRRTGLAVTDPLRITANPLLTIETKELITWLLDYLGREAVDCVVVGHPTRMDGEESESMNYIRPFLAQLRRTFPALCVELYDERFTSVLAHRAMLSGGMKKMQRRDKAVVDRIAACIILEDWLESRKRLS